MNWTDKDQTAARRQGWGIFLLAGCRREIQRVDEKEKFASDVDALLYVCRRACTGSVLHATALAMIAAGRHKL